jgi:hypothetical protein
MSRAKVNFLELYLKLCQHTGNSIGIHAANGVLVTKEDTVFITDPRGKMMRMKLYRRMISCVRVDDRDLLIVREDLVFPGVHVGTRTPVGIQQIF